MSNGERPCNEDANCHAEKESLEQSSDAQQTAEDKRKEELYSDGGGRKTEFAPGEPVPPEATENDRKK